MALPKESLPHPCRQIEVITVISLQNALGTDAQALRSMTRGCLYHQIPIGFAEFGRIHLAVDNVRGSLLVDAAGPMVESIKDVTRPVDFR